MPYVGHDRGDQGETINTGPGPRTRSRIEDWGPKDLAVLHLAFMTEMQLQATQCVNVLSSNLRLCHCESHRVRIVIHTKDTCSKLKLTPVSL